MSRFRKLSQTIWHCQYHIMWTPKYRYRILTDQLGLDVDSCIRAFSDQLKCEITELNVQLDHVHLLVMVFREHKKVGCDRRPSFRKFLP